MCASPSMVSAYVFPALGKWSFQNSYGARLWPASPTTLIVTLLNFGGYSHVMACCSFGACIAAAAGPVGADPVPAVRARTSAVTTAPSARAFRIMLHLLRAWALLT